MDFRDFVDFITVNGLIFCHSYRSETCVCPQVLKLHMLPIAAT
jgi:hypothetical protein